MPTSAPPRGVDAHDLRLLYLSALPDDVLIGEADAALLCACLPLQFGEAVKRGRAPDPARMVPRRWHLGTLRAWIRQGCPPRVGGSPDAA